MKTLVGVEPTITEWPLFLFEFIGVSLKLYEEHLLRCVRSITIV